MANRVRGEKTLKLGEATLTLRPEFGNLVEVEELFDASVEDVLPQLGGLRAEKVARLLHIATTEWRGDVAHEAMSYEEICALIPGHPMAAKIAVIDWINCLVVEPEKSTSAKRVAAKGGAKKKPLDGRVTETAGVRLTSSEAI